MKNKEITLVFSYLLILILSACQSPWEQPIGEFEIVYYVNGDLGFVMANGENNHVLDFGEMFRIPTWSMDGKILYGLSGYPSDSPAYWDIEKGQYKVCEWKKYPLLETVEPSGNIDNPYEVIMQNNREVILLNLENCEQIRTLVDFNDQEVLIDGISYSTVTHKLVFGLEILPYTNRKYKIMITDENFQNMQELAQGIHPTWSPDGSTIAYLGSDGVYLVNADGTNNRRLTDEQVFSTWASGNTSTTTPIPRWSPDGKWIIYHLCKKGVCHDAEAEIFKVNISSGQVIKILTGGTDPNWRPLSP